MKTYIKIGEKEYPAAILGSIQDSKWDGRKSKTIRLEISYEAAIGLFVNGAPWSIIERGEVAGQAVENEYDNSEYCVAGDITDHRDGTVSVKMGMATADEILAILTGEAST